MRQPGRLIRLVSALAFCTAIAVLAGCGGADETEPTQAPAASNDEPATVGAGESPGQSEARHVKKRKPSTSAAAAGSPNRDGSGDAGEASPGDGNHHGGKSSSGKHDSAQLATNNCPQGTSNQDCAKVKAFEQSHGKSPVRAADECPAAMSSSECQQAGKFYEEAQTGSHVAPTNQCPAAMTEAECLEAGKAYEEATR